MYLTVTQTSMVFLHILYYCFTNFIKPQLTEHKFMFITYHYYFKLHNKWYVYVLS
jgi:hypothetical protein